MNDKTALDEVLESYRDMFGVKTERADELHKAACIEVWQLRETLEAALDTAQKQAARLAAAEQREQEAREALMKIANCKGIRDASMIDVMADCAAAELAALEQELGDLKLQLTHYEVGAEMNIEEDAKTTAYIQTLETGLTTARELLKRAHLEIEAFNIEAAKQDMIVPLWAAKLVDDLAAYLTTKPKP